MEAVLCYKLLTLLSLITLLRLLPPPTLFTLFNPICPGLFEHIQDQGVGVPLMFFFISAPPAPPKKGLNSFGEKWLI